MTDAFHGSEPFIGSSLRKAPVGRSGEQSHAAGVEGGVEVRYASGLRFKLVDGVPVPPERTASRSLQMVLKRALLDIPLSLLALVVLAPLLVLVAVAIRLESRGPALFTQKRVGLGGQTFRLLKFRTMRAEHCDDSGLAQVEVNDNRVTRLGKFLRATSIDELPQLWNILVGEMAIIGPRPMVEGMKAAGLDYRQAVPYYDFRHLVKPGLSGWAQANGLRGPTTELSSARQRVDHDCAYVQNASFALDVRIIFRTVIREFLTGTGV